MAKKYIILAAMLALMTGCGIHHNGAPVSMVWEMGQNQIEPGVYSCTFRIVNRSNQALDKNWTIYFGQMPAMVISDAQLPIEFEQISSSHFKMSPSANYKPIAAGDTLSVTARFGGSLIKISGAPEGAYIVVTTPQGTILPPQDVAINVIPFDNPTQWSRDSVDLLTYPYGDVVYDANTVFAHRSSLKQTDIFPSVKSAAYGNGDFEFTAKVAISAPPCLANEAALLSQFLEQKLGCTIVQTAPTVINLKQTASTGSDKFGERYHIALKDGKIDISGATPHAIFNGTQTLLAMLAYNVPCKLPNVVIEDYPDFGYRGLMLDVARNFTSKKNVLKLIDMLSFYKLNTLHLHLTDDEAWRIEIPGIEELTEVGARRGHTTDEYTCLYPAYGSGWNGLSKGSLGSGFYSREEFIEILKYANARHIRVIPEIDLPAHARAAIQAMNSRYKRYISSDREKAEQYLLDDFADTSVYRSAQSYTDNVINVALPSAYSFVKKVVAEMASMYSDAGLKLQTLHLGGDEVPIGAWEGSAVCTAFIRHNSLSEIRQLKDYFIKNILDILRPYNIRMGAWQEVALLPDQTVNTLFTGESILSYCWNTVPDWESDQIPYRMANAGFPVVLCNVSNFYFDLAYNKHHNEPGLYWGGFVNEYDSFNMLPYDIYKSVRSDLSGAPVDIIKSAAEKLALQPDATARIEGIQGQVWAETIRGFAQIEYYLFPKMFGLVERAWNATPQWSSDPLGKPYTDALNLYNTKISARELPRLSHMSTNFRVSQPGIKIIDGKLYANCAIADAVIRYTADNSEPNENSPIWESPIECNVGMVKAKAFYCGKQSVTTMLINKH